MNHRTHLSIRMDAELHDKLQYIAARIREFEKEHGPIQLEGGS